MGVRRNQILGIAMMVLFFLDAVHMQKPLKIPKTKFSCQGRTSGYYADLDTGCQIYHMCDGLGRQFSYACPNTTLFQQRMLICDHWYMVNCSTSEKDYSANLLIGQKDKPFVPDDEDHQRTPRPDILTVPYAQSFNYYGISKIPVTSGSGSIDSSVDESIANGNNDISEEVPLFSVPTHWSTELTNSHQYTTPSPVTKHETAGFTGRPIIVTNPIEDGEVIISEHGHHLHGDNIHQHLHNDNQHPHPHVENHHQHPHIDTHHLHADNQHLHGDNHHQHVDQHLHHGHDDNRHQVHSGSEEIKHPHGHIVESEEIKPHAHLDHGDNHHGHIEHGSNHHAHSEHGEINHHAHPEHVENHHAHVEHVVNNHHPHVENQHAHIEHGDNHHHAHVVESGEVIHQHNTHKAHGDIEHHHNTHPDNHHHAEIDNKHHGHHENLDHQHNTHSENVPHHTERPFGHHDSGIVSHHGHVGLIVNPPSKHFEPPKSEYSSASLENDYENIPHHHHASSTTVRSIASFNHQFLNKDSNSGSLENISGGSNSREVIRNSNSNEGSVIDFIKRFDPSEEYINSNEKSFDTASNEDVHHRSINSGLEIQSSSETAGFIPHSNNHILSNPGKASHAGTNAPKQSATNENEQNNNFLGIAKPALDLLPPKTEFSDVVSTTMGPPIYYEWKWAAPAFDLEPPSPVVEKKEDKNANHGKKEGRPDFALPRETTLRPTTITQRSISDQKASEDNYKLSSYFIPDYVFPLDKQHPGYEEDGALTSFQVRIPHSVDAENKAHPYYGENAKCPQCHPSFVKPGTCQPCVMIRR